MRTIAMLGAALIVFAPTAALAAGPISVTQAASPADVAELARLEAIGIAAIEAEDWPLVETTLKTILPIEQRVYGHTDARIGATYSWLIRAVRELERPAEELEALLRARLVVAEANSSDTDSLASSRHGLAQLLSARSQYAEAATLMEAALGGLRASRPAADPDVLAVMGELAAILMHTGRSEEALALSQPVLEAARANGSSLEIARAANGVAAQLYTLTRYAEAEPLYREALDRFNDLAPPENAEAAISAYWLEDTLKQLGRHAEREAMLARVVELEGAPGAVRVLTDAQLIETAMALGDRLVAANRRPEAEAPYRVALEVRRRLPEDREALATTLTRLAYAIWGGERAAEAEPFQREALALYEQLRGERHFDVADAQARLGGMLLDQYRYMDALELLTRAVDIQDELGEATPVALERLALAQRRSGRYGQAAATDQRLVALREAEGGDPEALARALISLGDSLYQLEDYAGAETAHRRGFDLATDPERREDTQVDIAMDLVGQGRGDEAERLIREALTLTETRTGPDSYDSAVMLHRLGTVIAYRDYERGLPLLRRALQVHEAQAEPDRVQIAAVQVTLGVALSGLGEVQEAIALYASAFKTRRDVLGGGHPDTVAVIRHMAMEMARNREFAASEPLLRQLVQLREMVFGPDHPQTAAALQELAYVVHLQDRHAEAEPLMRRALSIVETQVVTPKDRIRIGANLGVTLNEGGRPVEAVLVFRQAAEALQARLTSGVDAGWLRSELDDMRYLFRNQVNAAWSAAGALETALR
jgi:tetratricopeptide (TPR) repeat protein